MITQQVVWTLLPNGVNAATKRAKASVLVSPRLTLPNTVSSPDLSQFPNWLDWPAIIRNANFEILVNGGAVKADIVSNPDTGIWNAIFPSDTFVKPWVFDEGRLRDKVILSYPVAAIAAIIENLYGELGVSAQIGLPDRRGLAAIINGSSADAAGVAISGGVRPNPLTPDQVIDRLRKEQKRGEGRVFQKRDVNRESPEFNSRGSKAGVNQGLMADPQQALDLLQAYHTPLEAVKAGAYLSGI